VAGLGVGFLVWQFEQPPFPLTRLKRLHAGMTTNDVRQVLGAPTSSEIRTDDSGRPCTEWAYSQSMSWPIVYVYFKPEGTFESHRYDP
jgi:hypothetical protein